MTKQELLTSLSVFKLTPQIVKEEHTELGSIFYLAPSKEVTLKALSNIEEDLKIALGVSALKIEPDYINRSIKLIISNSTSDYADPANIKIEQNSLTVPIGVEIDKPIYHNFKELPHLIIAGATGSGKSFLLHNILLSLVENNSNISIAPIDFKGTELVLYQKFINPIIGTGYASSIKDAEVMLKNAVGLMNFRYIKFRESNVHDIEAYNATTEDKIDRVFIVIDELGDLMTSEDKKKVASIKTYLIQLAQKARGAGIHLILATQRPTVDIISGHIKANIPARIALRTATSLESRIILDEDGAESLQKGCFLYRNPKVGVILGKSLNLSTVTLLKRLNTISYKANEKEYETLRKYIKEDEPDILTISLGDITIGEFLLKVIPDKEKINVLKIYNKLCEIGSIQKAIEYNFFDVKKFLYNALEELERRNYIKINEAVGLRKTDSPSEEFLKNTYVRKVERELTPQERELLKIAEINKTKNLVMSLTLEERFNIIKEAINLIKKEI